MTSDARLAANRANAQLSTGPRTPEGKAVVALNPVRHGVFSRTPVLPTEDPAEWEVHRAGVTDGLRPVGTLELALAERVALILWRLGRLARYEAESAAARIEDADLPPAPGPTPVHSLIRAGLIEAADARTLADEIRDRRRKLDECRAALEPLAAAVGVVSPDDPAAADEPVTEAVAHAALRAAYDLADERERADLEPEDPEFLWKHLGQRTPNFEDVRWTAGLVRAGIGYYAGRLGWDPVRTAAAVAADLAGRRDEKRGWADRLAREVEALEVRLRKGAEWRRSEWAVLPGDQLEKVTRYEAHLTRQLQLTLDQLRIL